MKFLIQTYNGKVEHDFSFSLIESIKYNNWLRQSDEITYVLSDTIGDFEGYIPSGSVEFVENYIKKWFKKDIKPINIPLELIDREFTGRKVYNGSEKDILKRSFVKSMDKIKHFTEITETAPIGNYQISEIINIISEYRCFVYKNELVGIQNYSGDFKQCPDFKKIDNMIKTYKSSPKAYTLDIAILEDGNNVVIEVHDFFSVGLYGFNDLKKLVHMFSSCFYEII